MRLPAPCAESRDAGIKSHRVRVGLDVAASHRRQGRRRAPAGTPRLTALGGSAMRLRSATAMPQADATPNIEKSPATSHAPQSTGIEDSNGWRRRRVVHAASKMAMPKACGAHQGGGSQMPRKTMADSAGAQAMTWTQKPTACATVRAPFSRWGPEAAPTGSERALSSGPSLLRQSQHRRCAINQRCERSRSSSPKHPGAAPGCRCAGQAATFVRWFSPVKRATRPARPVPRRFR